MNFQKRGHNTPDKFRTRERYGEAFWRKHHEAWQQSALNQREYCEAHGIPLGLELLVAADVIDMGHGPISREPCGARSRRSHLNLSELLFERRWHWRREAAEADQQQL